jgi:hypothetical protein
MFLKRGTSKRNPSFWILVLALLAQGGSSYSSFFFNLNDGRSLRGGSYSRGGSSWGEAAPAVVVRGEAAATRDTTRIATAIETRIALGVVLVWEGLDESSLDSLLLGWE